MSWGYSTLDGPETWCCHYPAANGCRQSPINVETNKIVQERQFLFKQPLTCNYDIKKHKYVLRNTGASWQVNVQNSGSVIEGGPLGSDKYELIQFHSHWGKEDDKGSEHTVNGRQYAAEIHFVHWNKDKFISFEQAVCQPNGLAVIGVLFELGNENKELNKICSLLSKISDKDQEIEVPEPIDPMLLFPKKDKTYWCYEGSLTTPPCFESVSWILYKTPVEISWEQLQTFRQINSTTSGVQKPSHIVHNFRPVQPVGARIVREIPFCEGKVDL